MVDRVLIWYSNRFDPIPPRVNFDSIDRKKTPSRSSSSEVAPVATYVSHS